MTKSQTICVEELEASLSKRVTEVVDGLRSDGVAFFELGDRHSRLQTLAIKRLERVWKCLEEKRLHDWKKGDRTLERKREEFGGITWERADEKAEEAVRHARCC